MSFPKNLAALRKENSLTQQVLADKLSIYVSHLQRYEAVSKLDANEKKTIKELLEGMRFKHEAKKVRSLQAQLS